MRNRKSIIWSSVLFAASTLIAVSTWAVFAQPATGNDLVVAPSYPGKTVRGSYSVISTKFVQMGLQAYYKVYGQYPESWAAVRQAGIVQTAIPAIGGQWIDPDDSSLDYDDDIYYDASPMATGNLPRLLWSPPVGNQHVETIRLEPPTTYDTFLGMAPDMGFGPSPYVGDRESQRLFGALMCLEHMIIVYKKVHGDWPASQDAFFSSGLATIDKTSINPVTGQPFRFDGSAGDVRLEFGGQRGYLLRHVGLDGQVPDTGFTY